MRHLAQPIRRLAALAMVVTALGLAGCATDDDGDGADGGAGVTTTTAAGPGSTATSSSAPLDEGGPDAISVEFASGEVVGGAQQVEVELGEEITIVVTADVSDEVHVHGYDQFADVAPEAPATLAFVADIPGIFEVELEERGIPVLELEVS